MNFLNLANGLSASSANLNLWSQKVGLEHDDYLQQLFYGGTQSIALRQKQPQEMFCKKRPAAYKKKKCSGRCFPVVNFPLRTPFVQTTSGRLLFCCVILFSNPLAWLTLFHPQLKAITWNVYVQSVSERALPNPGYITNLPLGLQ